MSRGSSRSISLLILLLGASASARAQETAPRRWLGELNERGFYVKPSSFGEGSGYGLGVSFWKPSLAGQGLDLFASTGRSSSGNNYFEVRVGRVPHRPGTLPPRRDGLEQLSSFGSASRFFVYASARHRELDQDLFAGDAGRVSYARRDDSYDLVAGYQLSRHMAASAHVGYLDVKLGEASLSMPSVGGSFFRVGAELAFDDRDEPANPHRGGFLSLSLERFDGRAGAPVAFQRASLDARHFLSLGSTRHVLAFRALASANFGEEGDVPFYLQDSIGGASTMRGYELFRFRGDRLVTVSGEYRFEALRFLELAAFYDAGETWGRTERERSGLRTSYGFGLRLKTARCVVLRLEAARSNEGTQLHAKFGYSF